MKYTVRVSLCCLLLIAAGTQAPDKGWGEPPGGQPWRRLDPGQYVGSAKCAECHKAHYDSWRDSAHNKMIRPPVADGPNRTILADFSQPSPARTFELKDVKWVIGSRW